MTAFEYFVVSATCFACCIAYLAYRDAFDEDAENIMLWLYGSFIVASLWPIFVPCAGMYAFGRIVRHLFG